MTDQSYVITPQVVLTFKRYISDIEGFVIPAQAGNAVIADQSITRHRILYSQPYKLSAQVMD